MEKKAFKKALDSALGASGFIKVSQTWVLEGADAIVAIGTQKCDWDEIYFLNVGIAIRALGVRAPLPPHQCHISLRLESLLPGSGGIIASGTSLVATTESDLRSLTALLQVDFAPVARQCLSLDGIKRLGIAGRFESGLVFKEARALWETQH